MYVKRVVMLDWETFELLMAEHNAATKWEQSLQVGDGTQELDAFWAAHDAVENRKYAKPDPGSETLI